MRLTFFPNELHWINSLHSEFQNLLTPLEITNKIVIASNEIIDFPRFCTGEMQSIPRRNLAALGEPSSQYKDSGRQALLYGYRVVMTTPPIPFYRRED
jgi:hypothetical protein